MIRGGVRALPAAAVALLVSACTSLVGPVPSGGAMVGMVNATTIPVAVHVNGTWVGTFPAWTEARQIVVSGHGGPPWHVEFLSPDGQSLASVDASPSDRGGNSSGWSSTCGQLVAWFGVVPDDLPPLDPAVMRPANPPCR